MAQKTKTKTKTKTRTKTRTKLKIRTKQDKRNRINLVRLTQNNISIVKQDVDNFVKMYSNINKYKLFYKNLSQTEKNAIMNYKGYGYENINSFLYNNHKITELHIQDYIFDKPNIGYLIKPIRKYINYKTNEFKNHPEFIKTYIDKLILDMILVLDSLFFKPEVSRLNGSEILYHGATHLFEDMSIIKTEDAIIGNDIVFKSYISTSTSKLYALKFTNISYNPKTKPINCCLYILNNLINVPYIYIPWGRIVKRNNIDTSLIIEAYTDENEYLLPRNLKFKITNITNGLPTNYMQKKSFKQLSKTMKHINNTHISANKLDIDDYNLIIPEIYKDIKVFHLDFVGILPTEPIKPYDYSNIDKINILISKNIY